MITNNFTKRHIGPRNSEIETMLKVVGVASIAELINKSMPKSILIKQELDLPESISEQEYLEEIRTIAKKNILAKSYIGMGYYDTILPAVIQRNVLENPGWYTSYTPYQAEISQGRLEALLNFQTMVCNLTALPLSNCSLLDEATAASEAMVMAFNARKRVKVKAGVNRFFIDKNVFPQTIDVLQTRAFPLNIELVIDSYKNFSEDNSYFGVLVQYPNSVGNIEDYEQFTKKVHQSEAVFCVVADLMSLVLLQPPGEWGADIVVGTTQRFGIPMGFGGPHAAFLAAKEDYKRHIPGRIIGISKDASGKPALRMALQTREQHIKRERATSNICTAQALLASMAGFYAAYHGAEGLKEIAKNIHQLSCELNDSLQQIGFSQLNENFFDTLYIDVENQELKQEIKKIAVNRLINFRFFDDEKIGISINETTTNKDVNDIIKIFAQAKGIDAFEINSQRERTCISKKFQRKSDFLKHHVFNSYHSETEMMRYIKKLELKDLSLNRSMIPLGSCTMKLNAAVSLFSLSWPEFGNIHPFAPKNQHDGYTQLIDEMEKLYSIITGFEAVSFQPNSGAAGEYAGLLVIKKYLEENGGKNRNVCLIPSSAHGTNPASAKMAGMKIVIVKCDEKGNIDIKDLCVKVEENKDVLAAIMITYPSTHGVFEENIIEVIKIIHDNGGQVYMDGANMNAQVGYTNPGFIGADVCHLNLHKTFGIPHGGGGPGVGPIAVANHLKDYLPSHSVVKTGKEKGIKAVAAAPFGSALVLPISYAYVKLLGKKGMKKATEIAILNANYLKAKLESHYKILYSGKMGFVAHEMIIDCNEFSKTASISVIDIAKRLMDFGIHAPTVAFPVRGTLMIEPTESESLLELDRFAEAMITIRKEIADIEDGRVDRANNVLKNAPHTIECVTSDEWTMPYSREKAAYPVKMQKSDKYWAAVSRIDDAYGDRNLICTCDIIEN